MPFPQRAAACKRSPASTPSSSKRKPYRRTKRPKNYNDKSTITTCTPTAATDTPNVYDAVLGEAEDLLLAASDAQSLGRLKVASNYSLLLHARLVGLGKKFDRAKTAHASGGEEYTLKPTKLDMSPERTNKRKGATLAVCDTDTEVAKATEQVQETSRGKKYEPPPSNIISEAAINQLTNYLPSNIELDQAMVEHLARAAAELHQKRTGKRTTDEGLLNSPAMNTEEVFHYNKATNPGKETASAAGDSAAVAAKRSAKSESWTIEEERKFQHAVQKCGTNDYRQIAKIMGTRTEKQVRAHIEHLSDLDLANSILDNETPRKRGGGRGRKPPTTAMNTVPNANLDAKAMLNGAFLGL